MTTPALLDRLLGRPADRPALLPLRETGGPEGGATTHGDLQAASAVVARRLLEGRRSLEGARVALLAPPGAPFVSVLLGIWRAGGVAVPLSPLHPAGELEHLLATSTPEATVVDGSVGRALDEIAGDDAGPARLGRRREIAELLAGARAAGGAGADGAVAPDIGDRSPALMLFTSGTTGRPKGVCLPFGGVAATLGALEQAWRWREDDVLLHALPLHHTHGLIVALLGALWAGAAARLTVFDADRIWEALPEATVLMAVPTMYVRLMEALGAAPADRRARWTAGARALRLATSGSAALPASLMSGFAEATGQTILERYGMTEIGMALGNPYEGPRLPGSVGVPLPGVTVDIVDDGGRDAAAGQPGELRVRSPQLFLGYHGDAAATAAAYDEAGRFRTGDTGVRDAGGVVRLLGRTSVDILKSGGYKISALEIEEVLGRHPAVAEIAVIGVPDPVWGDCITACVVPRAAGGSGGAAPPPLTLDELRTWARAALAPYKLPRALRLLPALPRNPMGKVQKSLLQR